MVPPQFLALILPFLVYAQNEPRNLSQTRKVFPADKAEITWISQIMPLALTTFYPRSTKNPECTRQGILYKEHLSNLTLWAVQMLDSSALSESGIIAGSDYNFGNFDQCIKIHLPEHNLRGKHCMANLLYAPRHAIERNNTDEISFKNPNPFSSVWERVRRVKDKRIKHRDNLYWSVCIPSSCDHLDLEESLRDELIPLFERNNITVNVTVHENTCHTMKKSSKLTSGTLAYCFILGGFLLVVLIATFIHYFVYKNEDKADNDNIILMFSLLKNGPQLIEPERNTEWQFLSGIKVLSMFCIIYGHRMLNVYVFPLLNTDEFEERSKLLEETINLSGNIIVNTFLHVTGFLMFNKILSDIKKGRPINIAGYLIYKWARTIPVYIFIICSFIFFSQLKEPDPLWGQYGENRVESCKKNFWSHILFINNYYDPSAECLLPAWYLAVDMQLFVVCVIIGYVTSKLKKTGYFLLYCLLIASLIIPSVIIYLNGFEPILLLYVNFLRNYIEEDDYIKAYIPTHMRAAPYFYGMLTAIIAFKLEKKEYRFKLWQILLGLILLGVLLLGALLSSWIFYMPDRVPSTLERVFYSPIQKTAWSFGIGWVILSSLRNGYGYVVKKILSAPFFIPLNKLMLPVMLVHPLIQGCTLLLQRRPTYVNTGILLWLSAGDALIAYSISAIIYLIIEAPFAHLLNFTIRKLLGTSDNK